MTDYKHIHQQLVEEDHDYRAGWREERDGIWLALGFGLAALVVIVARAIA